MVGGLSSGTFKLDALDKFGNATTTADTTLNRVTGATASSFTVTDSAANRRAYIMGTMTLTSIKNFTVAGDNGGVIQQELDILELNQNTLANRCWWCV